MHRHHADRVSALRYIGRRGGRAHARGHRGDRASATLIVLAPSNPFLSIGPILALPGRRGRAPGSRGPGGRRQPHRARRRAARTRRRAVPCRWAVSHPRPGVAAHYQERYPGLLDALVVDTLDADLVERDRRHRAWRPSLARHVMRDHADRQRLAETILDRWPADRIYHAPVTSSRHRPGTPPADLDRPHPRGRAAAERRGRQGAARRGARRGGARGARPGHARANARVLAAWPPVQPGPMS